MDNVHLFMSDSVCIYPISLSVALYDTKSIFKRNTASLNFLPELVVVPRLNIPVCLSICRLLEGDDKDS